MAKRKTPARLSAGEIEILEMLWREGNLSLSEAHQVFGRPIGYTTMQTRLNRMTAKGLVTKTTERPARYEAAIRPDEVRAGYLDLLQKRVSDGSVVPLVAHLVKDRSLTNDEIAELKRLIVEAERSQRRGRSRGTQS